MKLKIGGKYHPSYLYRNVKIHQPNSMLHSIISEIPTPVYNLSKQTDPDTLMK